MPVSLAKTKAASLPSQEALSGVALRQYGHRMMMIARRPMLPSCQKRLISDGCNPMCILLAKIDDIARYASVLIAHGRAAVIKTEHTVHKRLWECSCIQSRHCCNRDAMLTLQIQSSNYSTTRYGITDPNKHGRFR